MKIARNAAVVSALVIVAMLIALFMFVDFMDTTMDAEYGDFDAVLEDRAVIRGWIPEQLPRTAINITERHDLDTNVGWGRFEFESINMDNVEEHWERREVAGYSGNPNRFWGQPHFRWDLDEMESPEAFYLEPFWLVLDRNATVGFFWQGNAN